MYLTSNKHLKYVILESWEWHIHQQRKANTVFCDLAPFPPSPHISRENMKSGQTSRWILGNLYGQERAEISIPSHHIKLLGVTLSILNCYVARQQVAEEAPSRERWIRDSVACIPLERITNEIPKEYEQFDKTWTEILVAHTEAFSLKSSPPMLNMSGESLCCASRRYSTDL